MNGAGRASNPTTPARAAPAAAARTPDGHAGRADGKQIDLGMGRRRVTGNDLFMFHALVSENDQTIEDLSELRPNGEQTLARYARQTRPPFVTDGLLDRVNARLADWLLSRARGVRQWLFRDDDTSVAAPAPARGPQKAGGRPPPPRPRSTPASNRAA